MTREILTAVLDAEGFKPSNHAYALPENRDVTCFISSEGEVMPIGRLTRIELTGPFVRLETAKQEHFYFAYEDVLGLKVVAAAATAKERGAGFAR